MLKACCFYSSTRYSHSETSDHTTRITIRLVSALPLLHRYAIPEHTHTHTHRHSSHWTLLRPQKQQQYLRGSYTNHAALTGISICNPEHAWGSTFPHWNASGQFYNRQTTNLKLTINLITTNNVRRICDRRVSSRVKGKVYRVAVRPEMLYGLETVALTKRQEAEREVAELTMLRFSLGITRMDKVRS